MEIEYPLWRIWLNMKVPLDELKHKWSYVDLLKANALLDMREDYENAIDGYIEMNKPKKGK